jgi:hypothetical protein
VRPPASRQQRHASSSQGAMMFPGPWLGNVIAGMLVAFLGVIAVFALIGVYARRLFSLPTHAARD